MVITMSASISASAGNGSTAVHGCTYCLSDMKVKGTQDPPALIWHAQHPVSRPYTYPRQECYSERRSAQTTPTRDGEQVLGTLAPSMQLELLQKMREKKTYINREKFAQHTGRPLDFSSFQMQQYLQSSAFRSVAVGKLGPLTRSQTPHI